MGSVLRPFKNLLSPGKFQVPAGQLQIDGRNSLTNGLIACFVPGVSGGRDITGNMPTDMTLQSAARFDQTPEGAALKSTTTSSGLLLTAPSALKTWTQLSLWWRGYVNVSPANGDVIIGISYDNAATNPFVLALIFYTAATTFNNAWNISGVFAQGGGFTLPSLPGIVDFLTTFNITGNVTSYVQGILAGAPSAFGGAGPTPSATSTLQIGADVGTVTRNANGYTNIAAVWNRELSASEALALYLDPYGFVIPAEYEMPAFMTAGGGGAIKFRRSLSALGTRAGSRQAVM